MFSADVLELHYPRNIIVSDQAVPEVNMLGSFVGCQVARHAHGSLIVHDNMDGHADMYTRIRAVKHVQSVLAGIGDSNSFDLSGSYNTNMFACVYTMQPTHYSDKIAFPEYDLRCNDPVGQSESKIMEILAAVTGLSPRSLLPILITRILSLAVYSRESG